MNSQLEVKYQVITEPFCFCNKVFYKHTEPLYYEAKLVPIGYYLAIIAPAEEEGWQVTSRHHVSKVLEALQLF
jgi:hypothetical protein